MLDLMVRLTFYEGGIFVTINADGTATIELRSDNLAGDAPIRRQILSSNVSGCSKEMTLAAEETFQEDHNALPLKQKPGEDDWELEQRPDPPEPKEEVFLYKKPGDKCTRCKVIKCANCPFMHEEGRCYATNRECFYCGGIGHYRLKCPANKGTNKN